MPVSTIDMLDLPTAPRDIAEAMSKEGQEIPENAAAGSGTRAQGDGEGCGEAQRAAPGSGLAPGAGISRARARNDRFQAAS